MAIRGRRPAGGENTRDAILSATREIVAQTGASGASVRAIAARAGVDPALIYHYFPTKAALVQAALTPPVDVAGLLDGVGSEPEDAGTEVVGRVLRLIDADPVLRDTVVALMRAALSDEDAASALRAALARSVLTALRGIVAPDRPELRATLVGSQLIGLLLARYVIRVPPLSELGPDELVVTVGPTIQRYLTGTLAPGEWAGPTRLEPGPARR
jgi:AcrR family transcriptional regulator